MTQVPGQVTHSFQRRLMRWLLLILSVYAILLSVGMVGSGFKWVSGGSEGARELFEFATNPFVALLIGILATSLVQSSSTVTSVVVGLVAGGLPIEIAIPMVMGANIGTTITNTLVSLGHIRKNQSFVAHLLQQRFMISLTLCALRYFYRLKSCLAFYKNSVSGRWASSLMLIQ